MVKFHLILSLLKGETKFWCWLLEAIAHNVIMFYSYSKFFNGTPGERLSVIPAAVNHILELEDGKQRYLKAVTELSKASAFGDKTQTPHFSLKYKKLHIQSREKV
ncbi:MULTISPECIES: type I restriction enzyme endonuclease domain-containing protein [unclassified Coleofasciculus]|uniref:type I restriction enzyme endonuclease domain-containing protein n=1 Tax=unclassified Coleofasciculus TaxID=2692782 RepID=UPI001882C7AA|nr:MULTISPECIES: type I restriction enzyme endonuclease domain-containing protein [unclassified Coleofasciculus]MBE9126036.1 DUF3387 domain-containing protein [Coleofasciculus sp. LEGE 07081]MBE9148724.1 DUF3387 domain-containing protein [Coleofasciculus sp. LEGE 07092]